MSSRQVKDGWLTGKEAPKDDVEFVLIGAGLPRTATMSTYTALEMILPGKCHHMARVVSDKTRQNRDHWTRAAQGKVTDKEWREFIRREGISAGVDYPTSLYWKELMKIYPNAKVLFNDRDPVKWYESVKNSIFEVCKYGRGVTNSPLRLMPGGLDIANSISWQPPNGPLGAKYPRGMFGVVEAGQDTAVQYYKDWKEEVIRLVPKDKLLVWHPKDGWGPLCKFLGVPVPDKPFPNVNDTASMRANMKMLQRMKVLSWTVITAVLAAGAFLFQDTLTNLIDTLYNRFV
jgi:hypothetical protein